MPHIKIDRTLRYIGSDEEFVAYAEALIVQRQPEPYAVDIVPILGLTPRAGRAASEIIGALMYVEHGIRHHRHSHTMVERTYIEQVAARVIDERQLLACAVARAQQLRLLWQPEMSVSTDAHVNVRQSRGAYETLDETTLVLASDRAEA